MFEKNLIKANKLTSNTKGFIVINIWFRYTVLTEAIKALDSNARNL
jgi:hypothetical protein